MIETGIQHGIRDARAVSRAAVLLAALVAAGLFVFWPSIDALGELWRHPERRTYQHGYLIAAIVAWLVFRERRRIAEESGPHSLVWLMATAAGSLAWAVAWNAGLQVLHFLLWPAVLWAGIAGALGARVARLLLFPIAFLYFATPIWDALTPILQAATVLAMKPLAMAIGMPVLIEGNTIHIPEGSFEIAGGCSGLNYLIVGLAIATLLGEINRDSPGRRLLLIAIGGGLALASNWLRVFIIIVAGHLSDMTHYLVRVDHYNFGWVLYAFVLALFFYIARRLRDSTAGQQTFAPGVPSAQAPSVLPAVAAAVALALGPLLSGSVRLAGGNTLGSAAGNAIGVTRLELPGAGQWRSGPAVGNWVPVFPGADAESLMEFSRDGQRVTVYTATYVRQVQGRELIGHESRIEGRDAGRFLRRNIRTGAGDQSMSAMEAEWRAATGARAMLWWTYRVGSRDFARDLPAQLWYGLASLWSRPVSVVVALRSECRPDCSHAKLALEEFASGALPELLAAASRTKD